MSTKKKQGSQVSGVGLTITEMSEDHFKAHLGRVLNRMQCRGASVERMKAANIRIHVRRDGA